MKPMVRTLLSLLLLAIVAVWGWTFVLVKDAVDQFGVVPFLSVRFTIATLVIGLFARGRFDWRNFRLGLMIGVALAAAYLLQTFGLDSSSPTNTGVITGLFAVFVPLINRIYFQIQTSALQWTSIGVSLIGLVLLCGSGATGILLGDWITLGAAFCFGLHVVLLDRHAKHSTATVLATGQLAAGAILFTAVWPMVEPFHWPSGSTWFALIITSVIASAGGFFVQTLVQQRVSAVQVSMIIVVEPLFAAWFGYLLAGDRLTLLQMFGGGLMFAAMVVVSLVSTNLKDTEDVVLGYGEQ